MAVSQEKTKVEVEPRTDFGKNACRRFRAAGEVPGNVYGMDLPPYSVSVKARRITEVLHLGTGQNTIITLAVAGKDETRDVMIRELQRDPVTDRVVHVDFLRVDPNRVVQVSVPIHLVGTPTGVKNEGGIVDFVHREVHVECLPSAIPEHFNVEISGLHVNQHVSVEDLNLDASAVKVLDDPSTIIATISAARAEEAPAEEVEAEEEAAAEAAPTEEAAAADESKDS